MHRVFPTAGMGEVPTTIQKSSHSPQLQKSPHQTFIAPTKQEFSNYNPTKTAYLALVIVTAPFLF